METPLTTAVSVWWPGAAVWGVLVAGGVGVASAGAVNPRRLRGSAKKSGAYFT
jgi:hypothetical protein